MGRQASAPTGRARDRSRSPASGRLPRLIDGTGPGRLFIYDEQWGRILVFLKTDGSYLEQWATRGPQPSMEDVPAWM